MSENNTPSPANGTPAPAAARTRSALWPVLGIVAALAAGGVLAWQMGWLERLGGGRPAGRSAPRHPRTPTRRVPTVTCASPTR